MKLNAYIGFLLMTTGTVLIGLIAPWWVPAIWILGIAMLLRSNAINTILTGALGYLVVWLGFAWVAISNDEAQIIEKTRQLLGGLSGFWMIFILACIALITGGLAGWTGYALRHHFMKRTRTSQQ